MVSERTFLMKIFARKDATDEMREMIITRCEELDEAVPQQTVSRGTPMMTEYGTLTAQSQAPSMQRLMAQNPDLVPRPQPPVPATPAAAQALAARQALLNSAGVEKPENGRRSPRKI